MKASKIATGAAALLLTGAAAIASANHHRNQTVYYSVNGQVFSTTITFDCSTGGTGCVKKIDNINRQLYFSSALTQPLKTGL